jgi:hypothetical protein
VCRGGGGGGGGGPPPPPRPRRAAGLHFRRLGAIAQLVERLDRTQEVRSSNLLSSIPSETPGNGGVCFRLRCPLRGRFEVEGAFGVHQPGYTPSSPSGILDGEEVSRGEAAWRSRGGCRRAARCAGRSAGAKASPTGPRRLTARATRVLQPRHPPPPTARHPGDIGQWSGQA